MSGIRDESRKIWKIFLQRIRDKYRLVILNEENFEERLSFRLSRLNVFIAIGLLSIILVVITTYIIAFTPLKQYIPGYTDITMQRRIYELQIRSDSIEQALEANTVYLQNLKKVLGDEDLRERNIPVTDTSTRSYSNLRDKRSKADSLLRADYDNQSRYNLFRTDAKGIRAGPSLRSYFFFSPVKGIVTSEFKPVEGHYGIDIVASRNEAVKAIQDGTVIFAGWTVETGNVIALQHSGNIISVYKHNSVLLRKQGVHVRAGESIAIIGETGELTTGPHLHLELWINGIPVNPKDYITF